MKQLTVADAAAATLHVAQDETGVDVPVPGLPSLSATGELTE